MTIEAVGRDILAGPASPELEETFQELGIGLRPPFRVCCFWVEDLESVSAREGAWGLGRFSEMAARSLAQVLARLKILSPGTQVYAC